MTTIRLLGRHWTLMLGTPGPRRFAGRMASRDSLASVRAWWLGPIAVVMYRDLWPRPLGRPAEGEDA